MTCRSHVPLRNLSVLHFIRQQIVFDNKLWNMIYANVLSSHKQQHNQHNRPQGAEHFQGYLVVDKFKLQVNRSDFTKPAKFKEASTIV